VETEDVCRPAPDVHKDLGYDSRRAALSQSRPFRVDLATTASVEDGGCRIPGGTGGAHSNARGRSESLRDAMTRLIYIRHVRRGARPGRVCLLRLRSN